MDYIDRFLIEEDLPATYRSVALLWFKPLATCINDLHKQAGKQIILGINGCQGSGKSTTAKIVKAFLQRIFDKRVIAVSLDDFYHTHDTRQTLAKKIHPLLATRGVPGTHDLPLLFNKLDSLQKNTVTQLPTFNKATDDRASKEHWQYIEGTPDIIILEGWCLGTPPQDDRALKHPVNALEAENDPQGTWRIYVNNQLRSNYRLLTQRIDYLAMLQAPSFDCVFRWRLEQEKKRAEWLLESANQSGLMNEHHLRTFIQHYQRLTEHSLLTLPQRVNVLINLDETRKITALSYPQGTLS